MKRNTSTNCFKKKRNFEYFISGRNTQMLEEAKRDFLLT